MNQYQWFPKMRNLHYQYLHDDDEKANAIWRKLLFIKRKRFMKSKMADVYERVNLLEFVPVILLGSLYTPSRSPPPPKKYMVRTRGLSKVK